MDMGRTNVTDPEGLSNSEIRECLSSEPWCGRFPPILTIEQTAELLQVSPAAIRKWHRCGELRCCAAKKGRDIRFFRDRVIKWFFDSKGNVKSIAENRAGKPLHIARGVTIYQRNRIWHARVVAGRRDLRRTLKTTNQQRAERRAIRLRKSLMESGPP
jgi:predicted site-specific integrase-resolvase